jgi:hypothetical protein
MKVRFQIGKNEILTYKSGLKVPIPAIPIPAFAVPYAAPNDERIMANAAPPNPKKEANGGQSSEVLLIIVF